MKASDLNSSKNIAILSVLLSALLYALCIPFAKLLKPYIQSVTLGGLLYFGAGTGLLLISPYKRKASLNLSKNDFLYTIFMVVFDILAISSLMFALNYTTGANASLIGNFELVATTLCAGVVFREFISKRLILAIILITIACIILNFENEESLVFNFGLYV